MKTLYHPPAVRTFSGNGEERAAQITQIQNRLDRLHEASERISHEVARIAEDVKQLDHHEPHQPTPPATEHN